MIKPRRIIKCNVPILIQYLFSLKTIEWKHFKFFLCRTNRRSLHYTEKSLHEIVWSFIKSTGHTFAYLLWQILSQFNNTNWNNIKVIRWCAHCVQASMVAIGLFHFFFIQQKFTIHINGKKPQYGQGMSWILRIIRNNHSMLEKTCFISNSISMHQY